MAVVLITPEAQAQFNGLPKVVRVRIEKLFVRLEQWPAVSGVKPLRGDLAGNYRMRTGDYRIQFRVGQSGAAHRAPTSDVVLVEKVGHRDGFYGE